MTRSRLVKLALFPAAILVAVITAYRVGATTTARPVVRRLDPATLAFGKAISFTHGVCKPGHRKSCQNNPAVHLSDLVAKDVAPVAESWRSVGQ